MEEEEEDDDEEDEDKDEDEDEDEDKDEEDEVLLGIDLHSRRTTASCFSARAKSRHVLPSLSFASMFALCSSSVRTTSI
jgi:hypothetical protein